MASASDYYAKETYSSDEENVDYTLFLPLDRIVVNKDFKFAQEPLLKPLLDKKRNEGLTDRDTYWRSAHILLQLESVVFPTDFSFTLCRHAELMKEMQEKMKELYSVTERCEYMIPPGCVILKTPVVAIIAGEFRRAFVTDEIGKDRCTIQPVDGGAPTQVFKKDLRFMHESLAAYPKFGYHGKLAGVMPNGRDWDKEAINAFKQICLVDTDLKYMFGMIYYFMANGTVALHLWTKNRKGQDVWVADEMIRRRVLRKDETPLEQVRGRASPDKDEQAALLEKLMANARELR